LPVNQTVRPVMEFTLSLGFHAPTWLILALLTPILGLVQVAAHSRRRSSHRLDQSEPASPTPKYELHRISATKKRRQINVS
jgi:hypothetical protein